MGYDPDAFDKFGAIKFYVVLGLAVVLLLLLVLEGLRVGSFRLQAHPALVLAAMLVLHSLGAALVSTDPVIGVIGNDVRYDGFYMIAANVVLFVLAYRIVLDRGRPILERGASIVVATALPVWAYGFAQLAGLDPYVWEAFRGEGGRIFSTLGNPIFLGAYTASFTLIELLVVIIIIAILASIAIPTFLGARMKAQDSAAFTLVRNAVTVSESAFVDVAGYTVIDAGDLE